MGFLLSQTERKENALHRGSVRLGSVHVRSEAVHVLVHDGGACTGEAIAWVTAQIERSDGAVPIAELREETGLSKSRLVARFREQIGVRPKVYARIIRFRRACVMLDAGAGSFADVALAAAYFDPPHMNAEFRELAGLTPREFLAVRYPGGNTAAETVDY